MKKLFTLFVAIVAASSMMAADFVPTAVYTVGNAETLGATWASKNQVANYFEVGDTIVMSPYILYQSNGDDKQAWTGNTKGGSTSKTWEPLNCFIGSSNMYTTDAKAATVNNTRTYYYNVTNCVSFLLYSNSESNKGDRVITIAAYEIIDGVVSTDTVVSTTYAEKVAGIAKIENLDKTKTYQIQITSNGSSNSTLYEVAFVGVLSTDPVLKVNTESVDLNVTAVNPSVSETVTFSGKNLTAGTYNLVVPTVEGMTVTPASVVVAEDGKLNAEVTISYTSAVEVAAASANISLTIDTLTQNVAINYSATLVKEYGKSINIEQLVLDNGMAYDIKAALAAAKIDFENIDALDSLNDAKTGRNEPYLGLKLKNAAATMGCWLKAGSTINVKFGNVGGDVNISINGAVQTMTAELLATPLTYTATEDTYLLLSTTSAKTVVVKQIMIDEAIAAVVLPESPVVPEDPTVGLDDINAAAKSVKFFHNGQLLIEKNGVVYNAQGAVVK